MPHVVRQRSGNLHRCGKPRRHGGRTRLDVFLERVDVALVPVTAEHVEAARHAWRRFGKGNHRAALNFGDCLAYALAKTTGEPILFKGEDFIHTDVDPA